MQKTAAIVVAVFPFFCICKFQVQDSRIEMIQKQIWIQHPQIVLKSSNKMPAYVRILKFGLVCGWSSEMLSLKSW